MKKILLLFTILFMSVITTACINNLAVQELNNKAVSYMDKGDTETAICRLKSSLDLDDEIYQTHYNLALAYNNVGEYKKAVEELNKVLELKPDFSDAFYTMAIAKEAIAFELLNKESVEVDANDLSIDELADLITKVQDAIETYNTYLVKKIDATETDKINEKIEELNEKIKEYNRIYASKTQTEEQNEQEEIPSEE